MGPLEALQVSLPWEEAWALSDTLHGQAPIVTSFSLHRLSLRFKTSLVLTADHCPLIILCHSCPTVQPKGLSGLSACIWGQDIIRGWCQRSGLLLMPCWVSSKRGCPFPRAQALPQSQVASAPTVPPYLWLSVLQVQWQTLPWSEQGQMFALLGLGHVLRWSWENQQLVEQNSLHLASGASQYMLSLWGKSKFPTAHVCPSSPSTTQWACLPCIRPQEYGIQPVGLKKPSQG